MLIAFCGKAGCGKSTIASLVQKKLGYTKYSMATPIKQFLRCLFMWDDEHIQGHLKETFIKTPFVSVNDIVIAAKDSKIPLDKYHLVVAFNKYFSEFAIETDKFDEYPATQYFISPRRAMQVFGTEVCRSIDEDIWIKCAVEAYTASKCKLVIDDMRFENEFAFVNSANGLIVNVTGRGGVAGTAHASESFDTASVAHTSFDNSGSKQKMLAFVDKLCNNVLVMADKGA